MSVVIHSKKGCGYCVKAIDLLQRNNIPYKEMTYDASSPTYMADAQKLMAQTGSRTFPQIFVHGKFIGGYTELSKLNLNQISKNVVKKSPAKRPAPKIVQQVPIKRSPVKRVVQRLPVKRSPVKRIKRGSKSPCKQYTLIQLRKMAAAKNISGRSKMNRTQLCSVLKIR
jgi:glutaredoxin 3